MTEQLAIKEHYSLQQYNSLRLPVSARYFVAIHDSDTIPVACDYARQQQLPLLVLGEGSNVVLSGDFPGLVIKLELTGIHIAQQGNYALVTAAAGESWHRLVLYCLDRQLYGLENLVLIPGSVGAAPVQNIGAYGVELKDRLQSVTGWNSQTQQWQTLSLQQCQLAYRDSIFKHQLKNHFIISEVVLKLCADDNAPVWVDYPALQQYLNQVGVQQPTPEAIADAVMAIRRSKLPDPDEWPNAGSFFKNPVVDTAQAALLKARFPDMVTYDLNNGETKLAAGWLIEAAGWKGKRVGDVGMHDQQALVLINYGAASAEQVMAVADQVRADVQQLFGVRLEIEPDIC